MIKEIIFVVLFIVMLFSTFSLIGSFFYFNFGWFEWYYYKILGWEQDDMYRRLL